MPEYPVTLPTRKGLAPRIDGPFPHTQVTQTAPGELQEELFRRAAALPGVTVAESLVSVPGARAFMLAEDRATGPVEAFQKGREFAHIHPAHDGSFHMTPPLEIAGEAYAKGWGEPHPKSSTPLIFGPRDAEELEIIWSLLLTSWRYASAPQDDRWSDRDPLSHPDIARIDRVELADLPL